MAAFVFRISSEYNLSSLKTFNGRINILKRHNLLESFELAQVKRDLIQSINCFTSCHTTYDLTKLGNIRKTSNLRQRLEPILPSRNKTLVTATKITQKQISNFSRFLYYVPLNFSGIVGLIYSYVQFSAGQWHFDRKKAEPSKTTEAQALRILFKN